MSAFQVDDKDLTAAEQRYLQDLQELPKTVRSRLIGWALELVPSIGFFCYGLYSDRRVFLVLGFISLLYFALWRMYAQFRGFRMISNIYAKRLTDSGK